MKRISLLLLTACLFLSTSAVAASFVGPVPVRNQNPLALLSLDMRAQDTRVLPDKQFEVETNFAFSNLFERQESINTGYRADLDMELFRHSYLFRYGFQNRYEFGIEVPFIHTSSGFLDGFLEGYHNALGLPNAGRDLYPDGTYAYSITQNGVPVYTVSQQSYGLSDMVLNFKHQIWKETEKRPGLAAIYYIKVPTGDNGKGLGSGSPDAGFQVAAEKGLGRARGYANLAYLVLGPNDNLDAITNPVLLSWMLGAEFSLVQDYLSAIAQLSGDTSLYEGTDLYIVDEAPLNLTMGFGGQAWEGHQWKFAFSEDPEASDSAVDFTLWFQWSYRWGS